MADMTPVDTNTQWTEDWSSASVVNHTIANGPTIRQPGFDLRHHTRSLITVSGQVKAHVVLTCTNGVSPNHLHVIVAQRQTMNHIVDTYPLTKFERGLNLLHEADDDAVM